MSDLHIRAVFDTKRTLNQATEWPIWGFIVIGRLAKVVKQSRSAFIQGRIRFFQVIDSESIVPFQIMYYCIFAIAGIYLLLFAFDIPQNIEPVMGELYYKAWCCLNIVCPLISLLGRRYYKSAAFKSQGEPNAAYAGAWMQLTGDFGTWSVVNLYVLCFLQTTYWGESVYGIFFCFMGVLGGCMLTLRSWRRIFQIRQIKSNLL